MINYAAYLSLAEIRRALKDDRTRPNAIFQPKRSAKIKAKRRKKER